MTNRDNTQAIKVLDRQMAQVFSTDAILAECRLILAKTQVVQPLPDIHRRFLRLSDACGRGLRGYIIFVQEKKHRWLLAILDSRQRNKFACDADSRSLVVDAKQEDGTDRPADDWVALQR